MDLTEIGSENRRRVHLALGHVQ